MSGIIGYEDLDGEFISVECNMDEIDLALRGFLEDLHKSNIFPDDEGKGIDLLIIAIMVYIADIRINRQATAFNRWNRSIKLTIPVLNFRIWNSGKNNLEKLLQFLTGDEWAIDFKKMKPSEIPLSTTIQKNIPGVFENASYDQVSLFSGGLDSLIGAINSLEAGKRPIFVSYAGESFVSKGQKTVFSELARQYEYPNERRLCFSAIRFGKIFQDLKREGTTRGRSFLFLALGILICTGAEAKEIELHVPENGLLALNIPLDLNRLGSATTRTTHPYYIHCWNDLLNILGIKGKIRNPYWDNTKGEMIKKCKNPKLLKKLIPESITCSHPSINIRWKKLKDCYHCGSCVPCIIRRSAIFTAWGANSDETKYALKSKDLYSKTLNANKAEGKHVRAFQSAIIRLKKEEATAKNLILYVGELSHSIDKLPDYESVYIRGMNEVEDFLRDVKTGN